MNATVSMVRRGTISFSVLAVLAALVALVVAYDGMHTFNFPVKAAIAVIAAILALGLVYYRPIVFPFAVYLYMVPFDNLLQTGSGTITKFLGAASAGVILLVLANRRFTIGPPAVVAAWGAFVAWNIVSLIWSEDPGYRTDLLMQTLQLYVLFFIFAMLNIRRAELNALLIAVVAGGATCSAYGIWLFTHGTNIAKDSALSHRLAISVGPGSFINADHFSAALVFPVALALVATLHFSGWRRICSGLALIVLLGGIYASATRGSLIAVAVIWLYLAICYRHRLQLAALAAVGLVATIPFPSMWLRFFDPSQGDAGGRYGIWGIALAAFKSHWLLGIGTGQFRLAYSQAYLTAATGSNPHRWQEDAHNLIASTSIELGIIGLLIILTAWFFQLRVGRSIPRTSSLFSWRIALEAATLGLFVDAMTVDLMFYKYLWITFMLAVLIRNCWVGELGVTGKPATTAAAP
jgi:hypothetical protein